MLPGENRFQGLDGGDGLPVGGEIVVGELRHLGQTFVAAIARPAEFDVCRLAHEALQDFDTVPALRALAPRFEKLCAVMVVDRVLDRSGGLPFDRALDAPLPRMSVPYAVVEAELHFLFDIAGT